MKKDFISNEPNSSFLENIRHKYIAYSIILVLCFLLYGNTISHEYALDDAIVITENEFTKKGFGGIKDILTTDSFTGFFGKQKNLVTGGRYRPLSLVTFAIEYEFFGKNPHVNHLINIFLYALTGIVLLHILVKLLGKFNSNKWIFSLPFVIVLLYLAHPLHTEVVANIKGRDEILTFLGALLALLYTLRYLETIKFKYLIFSFISFFLALLAKENAITFLAIIPLSLYFFTSFFKPQNLKLIIVSLLPIVSATALFLIIRASVLGAGTTSVPQELMNNPFLNASVSEKYATTIYTFGVYLKLLFFPHPLTFDYYPFHIPILKFPDFRVLISLLINAILIIIALVNLKKKNVISFGILFYFISFSIVSNVFFPIGTFMNERFMFISSLGFVIIITFFLTQKLPVYLKHKTNIPLILVLLIVLTLYSFKTINRNRAWENDFVLFTTDVKVSFNSAKSNTSVGGKLIEEAKKLNNEKLKEEYLKSAIQYLERAIEIYPTYTDALLLLGNAHFEYNKNYKKTLSYYMKILKNNPKQENVYNNIDIIFNQIDDVDFKIGVYKELLIFYPERFETNYQLGVLLGKYKQDLQQSITYLKKAVKINPEDFTAQKDLGVAYGIKGDYINAIEVTKKAIEINSKDAELFINLGISYHQLGELLESKECFEKAFEINPALRK